MQSSSLQPTGGGPVTIAMGLFVKLSVPSRSWGWPLSLLFFTVVLGMGVSWQTALGCGVHFQVSYSSLLTTYIDTIKMIVEGIPAS